MSTVRKVVKNSSLVAIWNIVNKFIALLIAIYLVRYLGLAQYGNYSFIIAYALFFGVFIDLGINIVLVREISKNKESTERLIANSIAIKLTLFVFVFLIAYSLISLAGYSQEIKTGVLIALLSVMLTSLFSLLITVFQANLKLEYPAFVYVFSKVILGVVILFISYEQGGVVSMVLANLAASFLSFILIYVFLIGRIRIRIEFNNKIWREILGPAAFLGFSDILATVIIGMDTILISLIRGNVEVGYYTPPSQLTDALTFIPVALMASLLPLMSNYYKTSKQSLAKSFRLGMRYMLAIAIPMAVGTTILSDRIITAIYGAQFLPSSFALVMMIWVDLLIFCISVFHGMIISVGRQKNIFIATGIAALFNIALNLVLIPRYGFIGASIALLLSYILMAVLHFYLMPKLLEAFDVRFIIKSVIASLLMALFIEYATLGLFVMIIASALLYFIFLAALGGISNEDIEILMRLQVKA